MLGKGTHSHIKVDLLNVTKDSIYKLKNHMLSKSLIKFHYKKTEQNKKYNK